MNITQLDAGAHKQIAWGGTLNQTQWAEKVEKERQCGFTALHVHKNMQLHMQHTRCAEEGRENIFDSLTFLKIERERTSNHTIYTFTHKLHPHSMCTAICLPVLFAQQSNHFTWAHILCCLHCTRLLSKQKKQKKKNAQEGISCCESLPSHAFHR